MRRFFVSELAVVVAFVLPACELDPLVPAAPMTSSTSSSSSSGSPGGPAGACGVGCPRPSPSTISMTLRQTLEDGSRKMAISGDTLVALCGSVRIFNRVDGSFVASHIIYAPVGAPEWESVAISADTLVLGAPSADNGRGRVHIFIQKDGVWPENPLTIAPTEPLDGQAFGASVAVHGDTIIVGAPTNAGSNAPESVYLFEYDGQTFVEKDQKIAPSGDYETAFGSSVALGTDAMVGAPKQGVTGAAYLLHQDNGYWQELNWYGPQEPVLGIGSQVAASDDGRTLLTAAAGIKKKAVQTVRLGQDDNYRFEFLDVPKDAPEDVGFGIAIVAGNDFVALGSSRWTNSAEDSGAVHVFGYSGQTAGYYSASWEEPVLITSPAKSTMDGFGSVLAASGNTLVVGAPIGVGACATRTYVYEVMR